MAERSFYTPDAQSRVTALIKEVEAQTAAELVVAVRHTSGQYRQADYLVGFAFALATLVAMLFLPEPFPLWSFPVDVLVVFVVAALVASQSHGLRRLLTSPSLRRANVERAARAAFVDMGITRTTGRTGVLVFVSMLERRVDVVADIGVDASLLAKPSAAIAESVEQGADFERFVVAVRAFGPILGAALPRQADDVNELPDEMVAS